MKRISLILLSLLWIGCNDARVPLGPVEDAPMDATLQGRWTPAEGAVDDELVSLRIVPFNDHEYYLEYATLGDVEARPEVVRFRGFITMIEGTPFANIQLIGEEDKNYLIVQYEHTEDDRLGIRLVDEEMDAFDTSEALYEFVREWLLSGRNEKEEMVYFERVEEAGV